MDVFEMTISFKNCPEKHNRVYTNTKHKDNYLMDFEYMCLTSLPQILDIILRTGDGTYLFYHGRDKLLVYQERNMEEEHKITGYEERISKKETIIEQRKVVSTISCQTLNQKIRILFLILLHSAQIFVFTIIATSIGSYHVMKISYGQYPNRIYSCKSKQFVTIYFTVFCYVTDFNLN